MTSVIQSLGFLIVSIFFLNSVSSEVVHQSSCSGPLTNQTGFFRSPELLSQPGFYPDHSMCKWNITLAKDTNVTITFLKFHTEACCDYVKITTEKGNLIGQYSGLKSHQFSVHVTSKQARRVDITFKSDASVAKNGFVASYVVHGKMQSELSKPTPVPTTIPTVPYIQVIGGGAGHSLMDAFLKMTSALTRIINAVIGSPKIHHTKNIVTFKSELYQGLKNIETLKSISSPALTKEENQQLNLVLKHLNQKAKFAILKLEPRLSPAVCKMHKVVGPCRALFRRYYYDKRRDQCRAFDYGGCQGNGNNFEKKEDCEKLCLRQKPLCPPGVSIVNCFANPCDVASCPAYKTTSRCESDYCGGCNANYFDQHNIEIPSNRCHCDPGQSIVTCVPDPCHNAKCTSYPGAMCRLRRCGSCVAEFVTQNGTIINDC